MNRQNVELDLGVKTINTIGLIEEVGCVHHHDAS